jgi:hypothetical protein
LGAEIAEDFSSDPLENGWSAAGDAALFRWDASAQDLKVTWDSGQPNSYFWHPLGTELTRNDDVQMEFDLQLDDVAVGVTPGQPFTFEIAVGLLNMSDATSTNFLRGTGQRSPNLLEFDYFPDSGFGATISPTIVSSNGVFATSFTFPLALDPGALFHVQMAYTASAQTLTTTLKRDGQLYGNIKTVTLQPSFTDYRLDAVAISSYSDRGADGSLLAHGHIDNLSVHVPDPPVVQARLARGSAGWSVEFTGQVGWSYVLERSVDLQGWQPAAAPTPGTGQVQAIQDQGATANYGFYRLREERP